MHAPDHTVARPQRLHWLVRSRRPRPHCGSHRFSSAFTGRGPTLTVAEIVQCGEPISRDVGLTVPSPRTASPLEALRSVTAMYAQLADSPRAAVRNLAHLLSELADPVLRRHLLRPSRAARDWYLELLTDAVAARELRADTDVRVLARLIEVTLRGSFLNWTLYREGAAADWLREDLDDMLRPHLMRSNNRRRRQNMRSTPCVVSVADHAGWVHFVCALVHRVPVPRRRR